MGGKRAEAGNKHFLSELPVFVFNLRGLQRLSLPIKERASRLAGVPVDIY